MNKPIFGIISNLGGADSQSSTPQIFFRGQIHNRKELLSRLSLEQKSLDEEIICAAYLKWGKYFPENIHGPFAIGIHDPKLHEVILARDRFGFEPLYFYEAASAFFFASDISSISTHSQYQRKIDEEQLAFLLVNSHVLQDRSIYKNISRVPPGYIFLKQKNRIELKSYWQFSLEAGFGEGDSRAALSQSVKNFSSRSSPTGIFISGGLDSSSLAALSNGQFPTRLYTAEFSHPEGQDKGFAKALATHLSLPLRTSRPEADIQSLAFTAKPEFADLFCEPCFLLFDQLLQLAKADGVDTVFLGHGGDDLFSPPPSSLAQALKQGNLVSALDQVFHRDDHGANPVNWLFKYGLRPLLPAYLRKVLRGISPRRPPAWIDSDFVKKWEVYPRTAEILAREKENFLARSIPSPYGADLHLRIFASGGSSWLFEQHEILVMRMGMSFRYPFFDEQLLKIVCATPVNAKRSNVGTKPLLRKTMRGLLPDAIRLQEKFQDYTFLDRESLSAQKEFVDQQRKEMHLETIGAVNRKALDENWNSLIESGHTDVTFQILNLENLMRGCS